MGNSQSNIKNEEDDIKKIISNINSISLKLLKENKNFFLFPNKCI